MGTIYFTKENSREMQRKAVESRMARLAREKEELAQAKAELAKIPASADEQRRVLRIQKQIDTIDELLEDCNDSKEIALLVNSKEKLWRLILPAMGNLKPRQPKRNGSGATPVPEPETGE